MLRQAACRLCRSNTILQSKSTQILFGLSRNQVRHNPNNPNETYYKQGSYEGPGKTTVNILNEDSIGFNMIDSYSQRGFRLNDNTFIVGPSVIFPTAVLRWNVTSAKNITMQSLSLFTLLQPKMDIIIIGHGEKPTVRDAIDVKVILGMKKKGYVIEVLPTDKAISTYNYLLEEGRVVAAALIPPLFTAKPTDQSKVDSLMAQDKLGHIDSNAFWQDNKSKREMIASNRRSYEHLRKRTGELPRDYNKEEKP